MTWPALEIVVTDALHDDGIEPDPLDLDLTYGVAFVHRSGAGGRGDRRQRSHRVAVAARTRGGGGRRGGEREPVVELALEAVLRLRLADTGSPELIRDEQEDQYAGGDAHPTDHVQRPGEPHDRRWYE